MFERYTEKARRTIFFARYEASRYGSPYIETEHLLLGLLRENQGLLSSTAADSIRKRIDAHTVARQAVSTSVDLPLSNESKRVIAYAAEEADRLEHRHIGTEHLLLGLLREKKFFAAEILLDQGLSLDASRARFAKDLGVEVSSSFRTGLLKGVPRPERDQAVEIHGSRWNADYVRDRVKTCRQFNWHWQRQTWMARDIVTNRATVGISFDVALAEDTTNFQLVKNGWKKDYCAICHWELFESKEDDAHGVGYTNGHDWICSECYEKFISHSNFFSTNFPEIT
jgi:hypothetical protein